MLIANVLQPLVDFSHSILRCNPWSHGGVDLVQDQKLFRNRAEH